MNMNLVVIAGNLTAAPEIKFLTSGKAVTSFRIANNLKLKDSTKTTFVDITAWEKTAEAAAEYLKKGSPVLVEGRLDLEEWTDKEGKKHAKHLITANRVHFVPTGKPAELNGGGQGAPQGGQDDIPFDGQPANPFKQ